MKDFLMTLVGVTLLCTVVGMLTPEGNLSRVVRFAGVLCVLWVAMSPLTTLLSEMKDGGEWMEHLFEDLPENESIDYDEIYNQSLLNGGVTYAETVMENEIIQRFSLTDSSLSVRCDVATENGKCQMRSVTVILRELAIFADPRQIVDFVNERWDCPCVVVYD